MSKIQIYTVLFTFIIQHSAFQEFNFPLNHIQYLKCLSIIKHLEIPHSIFVSTPFHQENIFVNVKDFSKETLMASVVTYEKLIKLFQENSVPNVNTMIIMKENDLSSVTQIFNNFEKLKILHRTHRFTWLVFLKFYNSSESKILNIPYNCRFLIAYSANKNDLNLFEIYKIKNTFFSSEFDVATMKNNYLYLKRMDMNDTEIVMITPANDLVMSDINEL